MREICLLSVTWKEKEGRAAYNRDLQQGLTTCISSVFIGNPRHCARPSYGFQENVLNCPRRCDSVLLIAFCDYDSSIFLLSNGTNSFIVDKIDAAVQTHCEEVLQQQGRGGITECCEEVEEKADEKSLDCEKGNVYAGIPRAMDNYVACRLATPYLPSPLLDRRTILWPEAAFCPYQFHAYFFLVLWS